MLLGAKLFTYTDSKNLTFPILTVIFSYAGVCLWVFTKYPDYISINSLMVTLLCVMPSQMRIISKSEIALTTEMVMPLIKWYHTIVVNPGHKRSQMKIQAQYYHPDIRKHVDDFHCGCSQCVKIPYKKIGLLPELDLTNTPWHDVAIDLIGLQSAKAEHFNGEFYTSTCIDTTNNLVEQIHIDTKSSDAIAKKFEQIWLAWYPRPL